MTAAATATQNELIGPNVGTGNGGDHHACLCPGHDEYFPSNQYRWKGTGTRQVLNAVEKGILTHSSICTGNGRNCPRTLLEGKTEWHSVPLSALMHRERRCDYTPIRITDAFRAPLIPPIKGFVGKSAGTMEDRKLGVKKNDRTLGEYSFTSLLCKNGSAHGDGQARVMIDLGGFVIAIDINGFSDRPFMHRYRQFEPQGALGTIKPMNSDNLEFILFLLSAGDDSTRALRESFLTIYVEGDLLPSEMTTETVYLNDTRLEIPVRAPPPPVHDDAMNVDTHSSSSSSTASSSDFSENLSPHFSPSLSPRQWDPWTCQEILKEVYVRGNSHGVWNMIQANASPSLPVLPALPSAYGPMRGSASSARLSRYDPMGFFSSSDDSSSHSSHSSQSSSSPPPSSDESLPMTSLELFDGPPDDDNDGNGDDFDDFDENWNVFAN